MKKQLTKKLLLNKNTVVSLESNEMKDAKGGYLSAAGYTCWTDCAYCTDAQYCSPVYTRVGC